MEDIVSAFIGKKPLMPAEKTEDSDTQRRMELFDSADPGMRDDAAMDNGKVDEELANKPDIPAPVESDMFAVPEKAGEQG
jgi:hypothetical protein